MIVRYTEERYPEPKNYNSSEVYIKINKNNIKISNIKLGTIDIQLSSYNTYYVCLLNENVHTYNPDDNTLTNKIFAITRQELLDKCNARTYDALSEASNMFAEKLQIDTGVINSENNIYEVVMTVYDNLENFHIKTSDELQYQQYSKIEEPIYKLLYPSYALKINDNVYKCTKDGEWLSDNEEIKYSNDLEIEIQKYSQINFDQPLNREYDNEQLYVMASIGSLDNEVINLVDGKAKVVLTLPENYSGEVSISVGRSKNLHLNTYKLNIV